MSDRRRGQERDGDDDPPRFDISWLDRPASRGDGEGPSQGVVNPGPPQRGYNSASSAPPPPGARDDPERPPSEIEQQQLDDRLFHALGETSEAHIVDLAAMLGVEFEDALRSALRLAARRSIVIEKRDPIANDHLVARPAKPRR